MDEWPATGRGGRSPAGLGREPLLQGQQALRTGLRADQGRTTQLS